MGARSIRAAELLLPKGHRIFGRVSGGRYDPCAFDMTRRKGNDDVRDGKATAALAAYLGVRRTLTKGRPFSGIA
jgi:hypothetical protein